MTPHRLWFPFFKAAGPATLLILAAVAAHSIAFKASGGQPPRLAPTASKGKPDAASRDGVKLSEAARMFVSALTPPLQAKAVFPFDAEERLIWHYVPMARRGVALGEMDEKQRIAARNLLQTALSAVGFKKVETIRTLETVLREVEGASSGSSRNPKSYFLTVFVDPTTQWAWALRY